MDKLVEHILKSNNNMNINSVLADGNKNFKYLYVVYSLFIDARKMDHLVDRVHRELADEETMHISRTYHAWRG